MKKKLPVALLAITASVCCALGFSACDLFSGCGSSTKKVGDYDSFMAATDKKAKIELTADIDFNGEEVTPIALKELNGNGHTIKNVKVSPGINLRNAVNTGHYISLLGEFTEVVKDVTFDNITIEDSGYAKYASFVAAACLEMDGVTVKNSTMTITTAHSVGGLTCKLKYKSMLADFEDEGSAPTNCGIEDCTIKADSTQSLGGICSRGYVKDSYAKNLTIEADGAQYVGGIVGDGSSAENCRVTDSNITAQTYSSDGLNPLHVGGIGGSLNSVTATKNCYVTDSTIKANAPYYSKGVTGIGSVASAYVGGIAGANVQAEYCYSTNNKIESFCTGDTFVGGLVGYSSVKSGNYYIKQCYAVNNTVEADGYEKDYRADLYNGVERALGGLVGCAHNMVITSCYVYGNTVYDHANTITDYYGDSYIYAGGLLGVKFTTTTVSKCAINYKEVLAFDSGDAGHVFGNTNAAIPDTCYQDYTEEQWRDGTTVSTAIGLEGEGWVLKSGELPTLKLD